MSYLPPSVIAKNKIIIKKSSRTPCFLFDRENFDAAISAFTSTFQKHIPAIQIFYAMKSNPHPYLLDAVVKSGIHIDVSSGVELANALVHNPKRIIFTGPGKTDKELSMALQNSDVVTVNIDSFGELRRLQHMAERKNIFIKSGVRITTSHHGVWNKFGIPLTRLKDFWLEAETCSNIVLEGIQVHMSWNHDATPYKNVIFELADYLRSNFSRHALDSIKFIDIGGGFVPDNIEGEFQTTDLEINLVTPPTYDMVRSVSIDTYAREIASALHKHLDPIVSCAYFIEPGQILSHQSMHILLKVIDVKDERIVIVDGGNNMIGWEKYESYYCPVYNLTHPSETQIQVLLYGSLCTPHDIWGYYCFASKIEVGDVLIIPNQGAYTHTLAQNFIKSTAPVVNLV